MTSRSLPGIHFVQLLAKIAAPGFGKRFGIMVP
jgi:hypothetical protein